MSKVRILSPRPENSNRRKCGGFNFLGGPCGFKRQTAVCWGSNLSLDLSSKDDKSACILVFMRTAQGLFSYTRIPSAYACGYPRSYSNGADACSHILGFAPIKICWQGRKRGVLYSKMHGMCFYNCQIRPNLRYDIL